MMTSAQLATSAVRETSDLLLPIALRDTALTVTELGQGATALSFNDLRNKCLGQIEALRKELAARSLPSDVIQDASYAQCALLDEAALKSLSGSERDEWEREPLQVRVFSSHDAGNELVRRMEQRVHETRPVRLLLAIFGAVLGLGFEGRFALDGREARETLMRAIDARLGEAGADRGAPGPVVIGGPGSRSILAQISPLVWVGACCVVAALVWFAANQWLTAAVARMAR